MAARKARPPKLPDSAPQDLKDFVACTRLELQLDPTRTDWLPRPPGVPADAAPTVTVTPSSTPGATNSVDVSVGWGFVALQLPVSVSGGEVHVDTSNVPDFGGLQRNVDNWANSLNRWMKSNGKEMAGLVLRDGKVHLTKRAVVAPPGHSSAPSRRRRVTGAVAGVVLATGAVTYTAWPHDDRRSTTPAASPTPNAVAEATPEPTPGFQPTPTPTPSPADFPEEFWATCDPTTLPCFNGSTPLIVWNGKAGITHNGSVPDALTGTTGPSQSEYQFQVLGPVENGSRLQVQTQCGGNLITGESALAADSLVPVQQPLYNYGSCRPVTLNLLGSSNTVSLTDGNWAPFEVGPETVTIEPYDVSGLSVPDAASLHAAGTTLSLLAVEPLSPSYVWLRGPNDANAVAPGCPHRWTFAAGSGDERLVAHGGGEATAPANGAQSSWAETFPCGAGQVAYTACTGDAAPFHPGDHAVVSLAFSTLVSELPPGATVTVNVGDITMQLHRTEGGWAVEAAAAPTARAILRGNAATFVLPTDALPPNPTYTVTIVDAGGSVAQPPQQLLGAMAAASAEAAPPAETVDSFLAQLSASLASGEPEFAFERLHPLVIEAFGEEACRAELRLPVPPDYQITVDAVGDDAPWTWQLPDGRSYDFPLATTVTLRIPGIDGPVEGHLVVVDGQIRWFTICDGV